MVFERLLNHELEQWKRSSSRKPLILRGARQVGKTTLVQQFAQSYQQYIYLNLEKKAHAAFFQDFSDVESILEALLLTYQLNDVQKKQTLLFIDEIQEVSEAIALLRYFYEDIPDLHVIAAGSLLEHTLRDVPSFPVGRVQYLYIFPFNFQEYLHANQMHGLLNKLKEIPVSTPAHHVAMDWFHQYALTGGMPEIVAHIVEHKKINQLTPIYESIWTSYRDDVSKYAKNRTEEKVIKHLLQTAPPFIDQRISFHNFGNSNYRSREVSESFLSLDDAKVIQLIYPTTSVEMPIITDFKKSPRLQFLDTGLLNYSLGIQAQLIEVKDLGKSFKGALIPHLITQELISLQQTTYNKPSFWVRQKKGAQAEVDLIYPYKGMVIPIEIKSGKVGKLRSLHQFVDQAPHPYAIRMYAGEFNIEQHRTPTGTPFYLMSLPYYLSTYLSEYIDYFIQQTEEG